VALLEWLPDAPGGGAYRLEVVQTQRPAARLKADADNKTSYRAPAAALSQTHEGGIVSFYKSGAVMGKEIRQWFEPRNPAHVIAFFQYEKTGEWPGGFIPSEVWFVENNWQAELKKMIEVQPLPPSVKSYIADFDRVIGIISEVRYRGATFVVEPFGTNWYMLRIEGFVGRYFFGVGSEESHVVKTCFRAAKEYAEDLVKKEFTYQNEATYRESV
jgi:hypothetical protein